MTDENLLAWVRARIEERTPESDMLDYKSTLELGTRQSKLELAKDVSSFANERGGLLLYGVPETDDDGIPIPKPLSECGFTPTKGLREQAENVVLDVIEPPLPELHLRLLNLDDARCMFFVYHPQSWARPHMVAGYDHARYYRRGNFRAVRMREREVEAAYAARRAVAVAAASFLATSDFGPRAPRYSLRVVLVPHLGLSHRATMRSLEFRNWLFPQLVANRRGEWLPFIDGWRFRAYAHGEVDGRQFDVRVFHSGAIAFTADATDAMHQCEDRVSLRLIQLSQVLRLYAVDVALNVWRRLQLAGPLTIRFELHAVGDCKLMAESPWLAYTDERPFLPKDIILDEEATVGELMHSPESVLLRVLDRLAAAGGLGIRAQNE
jgi:hypothetical protein